MEAPGGPLWVLWLAVRLAVAGFLARLIATIVYRWHIHPLSNYPGPLLAKFTNLYALFYAAQGPVVRLGPNRVAFSSPAAFHDIYTARDVQKSEGYAAMDPVPGQPNVFTSLDKDVHRRKRRGLSPAFSDQAIKRFESVIVENVDTFIRQLLPSTESKQIWSPSRDISALSKYFTVDIMGMFGFGTLFHIQTNEAGRYMLSGAKMGSILSGLYSQYPKLRRLSLHKWATIGGGSTSEAHGRAALKIVEDRLAAAKDGRPDLFTFVIDPKNPEKQQEITVDELWAESRMFLLAGSDTSSAVLSSVFFYLARFPGCCEKLKTEIRQTFATADDIRLGPTLSGCQYLRAVIDEAMRMSPPVGNALWRQAVKDVNVDQFHLPKGVEIGASLYTIFHSDHIYPDPFTFAPERWLETPDNKYSAELPAARAAFKPFSIGSRNCIGMNLAQAEMTLLLARAIWTTDFRTSEGENARVGEGSISGPAGRRCVDEFQMKEFVTPQHEGPYLEFRLRGAI